MQNIYLLQILYCCFSLVIQRDIRRRGRKLLYDRNGMRTGIGDSLLLVLFLNEPFGGLFFPGVLIPLLTLMSLPQLFEGMIREPILHMPSMERNALYGTDLFLLDRFLRTICQLLFSHKRFCLLPPILLLVSFHFLVYVIIIFYFEIIH